MKKILILSFVISILNVGCKKDKDNSTTDDLEKGLISQFNLDGNAIDVKGVNNGTTNGAVAAQDRKGNKSGAMSFDGVDDNIIIPGANLYNENFTYSIWYKASELPSNGNAYYFIAFGSGGADHNLLLANYYGTSYGICGGSYNDPNNIHPHTLVVPGNEPSIGTWNFIVLTRDNENLKLYVNSKLLKTTSVNGTKPKYARNLTDALTIGSRAGQFFAKGVIDDVRIYNRALSENEITSLYSK